MEKIIAQFFSSPLFNLISSFVTSFIISMAWLWTYGKKLSDLQKAYEDFIRNEYMYKFIQENYAVIKLYIDNIKDIQIYNYKFIQDSINILKDKFTELYYNGSERSKAEEFYIQFEKDCIENITNLENKDLSLRLSIMFDVIKKKIKQFIDEMEGLNLSKENKGMTITKFFYFLEKLYFFFKLRQMNVMMMTNEKEISDYFDRYFNDLGEYRSNIKEVIDNLIAR